MLINSRLWVLALLFSLTACSGGASNSRLDYKEAKGLSGLDVPPDLVAPQNTGETELPAFAGPAGPAGAAGVLPQLQGMRIVRDGMERWLVVDMPAEELWPRLRAFWATLGLEITMEESTLGIMETGWAENRADAASGFFSNIVKKVFKNAYSADTRDKYRLRLERGEGGGSEVYLSHYGLKEVVTSAAGDVVQTAWQLRPSDRELVYEVLQRLVMYLGGSQLTVAEIAKPVAEPVERARIEAGELVLDEGFARAWRRTGIALDRQGIVVEDRNRAQGIYYVSNIDLLPEEGKKGWLGSIFSTAEKENEAPPQLQVVVRGDTQASRVELQNMDGTPRHDKVAEELLKRLYQELK